MKSNKKELLNRLLEYQFACIELNLYLDNNPHDENALDSYNTYLCKFMQTKEAYECEYGPLTMCQAQALGNGYVILGHGTMNSIIRFIQYKD